MKVPFVDLGAQYQAHKSDFDAAIARVVENTSFIGGQPVRTFEETFSRQYGVKHCISCANGTDAIYIALKMLGIGAGDEVITSAASWISTSETISQTGAVPVFVDVNENYLIDTCLLEQALTEKTKAVIPVHLYGQAAEMDDLVRFCRKNGLKMIEDCAQAHFSQWRGRRVGTFGDAATFSFYPGKNLGAWGDAGAIVTNDDDLANACRMFANHGALVKHEHLMEGVNSRMDGLQASLLTTKLRYIDEWTRARQRIAQRYNELLTGVGDLSLPAVHRHAEHVYHLYVVNTAQRDALKEELAANEIQSAIHYPTALPLLPAYRHLGITAERVPVAAGNQSRILSLPIYPEMSDQMIEFVVQVIRSFFKKNPSSA